MKLEIFKNFNTKNPRTQTVKIIKIQRSEYPVVTTLRFFRQKE